MYKLNSEKMFTKFICFILFAAVCITVNINSQNSNWKIYTSFREVKGVASDGNNVWGATSGGLFRFDAATLSGITKFTSLDGLLSNELTSITTGSDGKVWVGAFDGSISVLNTADNTWKQVTDIRSSTEPSKKINAFYRYNDLMFFATQFCIVKFSVSQFEFVDQPYVFLGPSLPIKTAVNDVFVINDTIWAATVNGIAYANINNSLPIQSTWSNFVVANSVLKRNTTNCISYFDSRVLIGSDSGIVSYRNNTLSTFAPVYNGVPIEDGVYRMIVSGDNLYFSTFTNYGEFRGNFRVFKVNRSNINNAELLQSGTEVNSLKVDLAGDLLIGTVNSGVNVYRNNTNNFVIPNGPYSNLNLDISVDNSSRVWAVSGSLGDWSGRSGIYRYESPNWFNYTYSEFPVLSNGCCGWVNTYPDRLGNEWISGWGNGLLKISGSEMIRYDETNSVMNQVGAGFVLTYGIDEDNNGDLWVLNGLVDNAIVNFTQQVTYNQPVGGRFAFFTQLAIDNYNTKWMLLHPVEGNVRGVMFFNENTNPTGNLISYQLLGSDVSQVNDIVTDNNGEVWVATNNGVIVIPNPEQVINQPGLIPTLFKMRLIENGISTPLTENVLSIEVDALNNKWLGTINNGVIYVSPDGSTLLKRFTTANSPMINNQITSIKSDRKTGTVYFGSVNGIVSYNTIAVSPLEECDKISCGPNPFLIPSETTLKIDGLVEESTVKILSVSGFLVSEFETPGGRIAEWDGKDLNGNYVSSGIYIIAGFNKDASKVCTGKVAVIRR